MFLPAHVFYLQSARRYSPSICRIDDVFYICFTMRNIGKMYKLAFSRRGIANCPYIIAAISFLATGSFASDFALQNEAEFIKLLSCVGATSVKARTT